MEGSFGELDANQKILGDAATMTQAGAAFASPVAGAVIGGLKQAVTSSNDAIKSSFFDKLGLSELFENVAAVRKVLLNELVTPKKQDESDNGNKKSGGSSIGRTAQSKWGYDPETGMTYGNLRQFMTSYDKTCTFEQALSDLHLVTDAGQAKLKETAKKDESQQKQANPEVKPDDQIQQKGKASVNKTIGAPIKPAQPAQKSTVMDDGIGIQQQILINNNATPF